MPAKDLFKIGKSQLDIVCHQEGSVDPGILRFSFKDEVCYSSFTSGGKCFPKNDSLWNGDAEYGTANQVRATTSSILRLGV